MSAPVPSPESPVPVSFAHRAEFTALRAVVSTLGALDWETAGNIGARIGALGYRPLGIRRGVVERQIAAAFPGLAEADVRRIALGAYENLGRSSIEAAILPRLGPNAVLDKFEGADDYDIVEEARSKGRGLIFVTGHLGNWELAGAYVAARGIPLDAIARRMKNPLFDRYLTETRSQIGMHVVHDSEAVRRTPRSLREGRAVAFLSDQGVLGLASTFVPFFGRPAKTPRDRRSLRCASTFPSCSVPLCVSRAASIASYSSASRSRTPAIATAMSTRSLHVTPRRSSAG